MRLPGEEHSLTYGPARLAHRGDEHCIGWAGMGENIGVHQTKPGWVECVSRRSACYLPTNQTTRAIGYYSIAFGLSVTNEQT